MNHGWRTVGLVAGVAAAAVTGTAIGLVTRGRRARRSRPHSAHLGEIAPDRESVVVADDGLSLSVLEIDPADGGAPELTVVLVHGFILDRRMWHFQRVQLAESNQPRVRTVLYDQRSHGRSAHSSRRASTIEQLGRDLHAVLDAVVPDGQVVLVGHSMGAMTIMALAEQQPELFQRRICGVGLICTSAGDLANMRLARPFLASRSPVGVVGVAAARRPGLVEWGRRAGADASRALIRTFAFGDHRPAPELLDLMNRMIAGTSVEVMTDFLRTLREHDRFRALAGLRYCQVLVIGGDADRITPYSHTEALAAELPDAELVRIPGAGHMAPLEQPSLVGEHLAELLRRCHRRGGG